jgi:hypothetical protein
MLSGVKHFAFRKHCSVCLLWGMTQGVAYCRFEELFEPIADVKVVDVPARQYVEWLNRTRAQKGLAVGAHWFPVLQSGRTPERNVFSWDLWASHRLAALAGGRPSPIVVRPSASIRSRAERYDRAFPLSERLGIRIRVEELRDRQRRPHRVQRELDDVLKSLTKIPRCTKVFIVTDSEYLQRALLSHFPDSGALPKRFDLATSTGRYVHRQDKRALFTFVQEVECLTRCRRIINIGGFLNDHAVAQKTIQPPYEKAQALLRRVDCEAISRHSPSLRR